MMNNSYKYAWCTHKKPVAHIDLIIGKNCKLTIALLIATQNKKFQHKYSPLVRNET